MAVVDEVLEAEAVADDGADPVGEAAARALPAQRAANLPVLGSEARTVAIAAAGGIVAGAATVAVARAASRVASPAKRGKRRLLRRDKQDDIIASRSFLVDVHLLGR